MSHVNKTHYTSDHVADARACAKAQLSIHFPKCDSQKLPTDISDKNIVYLKLIWAIAEDQNPLAFLKDELTDIKERPARIQRIIDVCVELELLFVNEKSAHALRLALYPQVAILLAQEEGVRKHKNIFYLKFKNSCGEQCEYSVLDFLVTVECEREEESETVIVELSALAQGITLASDQNNRWVAKLTKLYNGLPENEKKLFLDAVCEAAGEKKGAILQHLGLVAPKEKKKQPLSKKDKASLEEHRDEQAVKTLETACDRMQHLVTTTPKGWITRAVKLWQACMGRYQPKDLQQLADSFNQIANKDSRIYLIRTLLKAHNQNLPPKNPLEWKTLANNLHNTHLPKLAKNASKVGKKKTKNQKQVDEDLFSQFAVTNVQEVSLKNPEKLELGDIPTNGYLRFTNVPKKETEQVLCKLLQLCELDEKRRLIVLTAIQHHIDIKTLSSALATTIGRVLVQCDDKTYKGYTALTKKILSSLKNDRGLQETLRWRGKSTLDGLIKAATHLKKSPHAALCVSLLYSYVGQQFKRGKNGRVEKLAKAVDALLPCEMSTPDKALDRQVLSIRVWSLAGKKGWVNKAVILWNNGTPEAKKRTIKSVLRGIVVSDDPAHRREHLLTIVQSPQFRALNNRVAFACELVRSLLKAPTPEHVQIASILLERVAQQETELGKMYAETAAHVFKAISNIRNSNQRLASAQGFMIAILMPLPLEERKAWHQKHLSWLTPSTEFIIFSETLRYMPRLKNLLEPTKALYQKCVKDKSPIEHRLLLAARLMAMGEKRPEGIGKKYDALFHDCCFQEIITSLTLTEQLDGEWNGADEQYTGPAPELKRKLETSITATLMMRQLKSENPELDTASSNMLKLLKQLKNSDGQVLIAFNELCADLVKMDPTEKTIEQIGTLLQAAAEADLYCGKPDGMVLTCSHLLITLHKQKPSRVPDMWREILQHSGLEPTYLGVVANNWSNPLKPVDKKEFVEVFLVTAQVAAEIKDHQQSGQLLAITAELWAKAVRGGQLLKPDEACDGFLAASKIIVKEKGAVTTAFYATATVIAATYDSLEDSPIPRFVEDLCTMVRYKPIPGFKAAVSKKGFTSIEETDHPLYQIRIGLSAANKIKWSQLKEFSDEEIAQHLVIQLSTKLTDANTQALQQLVTRRPGCLKHLPKEYKDQPWRAQMHLCLSTLAALGDLASTSAAILAFDFPLDASNKEINVVRSFRQIAYKTVVQAALTNQTVSKKVIKRLINLIAQHLTKQEEEENKSLLDLFSEKK